MKSSPFFSANSATSVFSSPELPFAKPETPHTVRSASLSGIAATVEAVAHP